MVQLSQQQAKITSEAQVKQTFKPVQDGKKSARQLLLITCWIKEGCCYRRILPPQLRGSRVDLCHCRWWSRASTCRVVSVHSPRGLLQALQNPGLEGRDPTGFSALAGGKHVPNSPCESCFSAWNDRKPTKPCFSSLISLQHHFSSAALTAFQAVLYPKSWV